MLRNRTRARNEGHLKYMPSHPCKNGHQAARYVKNDRCTACAEVTKRTYRNKKKTIDKL